MQGTQGTDTELNKTLCIMWCNSDFIAQKIRLEIIDCPKIIFGILDHPISKGKGTD